MDKYNDRSVKKLRFKKNNIWLGKNWTVSTVTKLIKEESQNKIKKKKTLGFIAFDALITLKCVKQ